MNFFNLLVILHFCLSWVDRFSEAHNCACCISALRRWPRMNFIAFMGDSKSASAIMGVLLLKCTSLKPSTSAMTWFRMSCASSSSLSPKLPSTTTLLSASSSGSPFATLLPILPSKIRTRSSNFCLASFSSHSCSFKGARDWSNLAATFCSISSTPSFTSSRIILLNAAIVAPLISTLFTGSTTGGTKTRGATCDGQTRDLCSASLSGVPSVAAFFVEVDISTSSVVENFM